MGQTTSHHAPARHDQRIPACHSQGIDLHTAAIHRDNLPQIRACLDDPATDDIPYCWMRHCVPGTIREAAGKLNIPWLVYEAGEALRFDEVSIRAGVRGIIQVMREIGMLPKCKTRKPYLPQLARKSYWVRASQSGIYRNLLLMIHEGDALCHIAQFKSADDAASSVEAFHSEFEVVYDDGINEADAPIQ